MLHTLRVRAFDRPLINNRQALINYLKADMAGEPVERLRVIFLDGGCRLLRDETLWMGTIDETPLYVREIIGRALELGAASLIVVHNHPSGDPHPSEADVRRTEELMQAGSTLGIHVHEQLIVAAGGCVSIRSAGSPRHG